MQFERVVQGAHSEFGVFFVDQTGNLNLGRTDHLDVDVFLLQGGEGLGRHAGVVAHSHADDGNLSDVGVVFHARTADPRDDFLHELNGFLQILAGHGERHVGHAFAAGGLDDHGW